jgi:hypothetical protein
MSDLGARKLKANASSEEAPIRKSARGSSEEDKAFDMEVDVSAPPWAQHMQNMMMLMMTKMETTTTEISVVKGLAQEAKTDASDAKSIALSTKEDVEAMKKHIASIQQGGSTVLPVPASHKHADNMNDETKNRTLTFGNFPEDTKSEFIIEQISKKLESVKADLEEDGIYAFGKKFATRGAVRFRTEAAMWTYLRSAEAKIQFEVNGTRIYTNRDGNNSEADEARDKAVRKLVRAIIEVEGGDAKAVKELIDTNYRKGIVRYKDLRVGEYMDGQMQLKGEGLRMESKFKALMQ